MMHAQCPLPVYYSQITGRYYFEEFHIHFISLHMLSVLSENTRSSPSYMSEPYFKKGSGEPLKNRKNVVYSLSAADDA